MIFRFDYNLTDEDYLKFNEFAAIKSKNGKRNLVMFRIMFATVFFLFGIVNMVGDSFSSQSIIGAVPYFLFGILLIIFIKPILSSSTKAAAKKLLKTEKKLYDKSVILEFYEASFKEITPETVSENSYSVIDSATVSKDEFIYLSLNSMRAHIVPVSCFKSDEERASFMEFLKSKNIEIYES